MRASMICRRSGAMATILAMLTGCGLLPAALPTDEAVGTADSAELTAQPAMAAHNIDYYSQKIANQLFRSVITLQPNAGIAVGTFTEVDSLQLNQDRNHPLRLLGLQLEEGLITATIRQGLKVIEYKTREKLTLKSDQDLMLSRQVSDLGQPQDIRYFLTGTLTEQENGVVVNARLIDTTNHQVVAAATDYVPGNVFWRGNKVKLKQDLIYRTAY